MKTLEEKLLDMFRKNTEGSWRQTRHGHEHEAKVHGHTVNTQFDYHGNDHYAVSFMVNRKMSLNPGDKIKPSHAKAIIGHVRNKVKEFAKRDNVKSLEWEGSDEDPKKKAAKDRIYRKLAQKHGMKISRDKVEPKITIASKE
jgi:hypothetical protein